MYLYKQDITVLAINATNT